jgi:thymidylate synthase
MHAGMMAVLANQDQTIGDVVDQLQQRIDALTQDQGHRRTFIKTYQRTTPAIGESV